VWAGQRRRYLTVLRGAIAVEHVLLNGVHEFSVTPARQVRPRIDDRSQVSPDPARSPPTMEG